MKHKLLLADSNASELQQLVLAFSNLEQIELLPPVSDCEQTLAALSSQTKPDILLLDLMLRGGDGFTVLDAIDAMPKSQRPLVFLMTAMSHERLLLALQERVVFCFIKPFLAERAVLRVLQLACEQQSVPPTLRRDDPCLVTISEMLLSLSVPAHLRGYHYLRDVIRVYVCAEQPLKLRITRDVYPLVAKEHGDSVSGVDSSIRTAIEFAWTHGNLDKLHQVFGYTTSEQHGKPSNVEFVTMVAEHIRLQHSGSRRF